MRVSGDVRLYRNIASEPSEQDRWSRPRIGGQKFLGWRNNGIDEAVRNWLGVGRRCEIKPHAATVVFEYRVSAADRAAKSQKEAVRTNVVTRRREHRLTRKSLGTAGESERRLHWMYFHNLEHGGRAASDCLPFGQMLKALSLLRVLSASKGRTAAMG